jgi:hypothetical protein
MTVSATDEVPPVRSFLAFCLVLAYTTSATPQTRPGSSVLPPPTPKSDRPDQIVIEPKKPGVSTSEPASPSGIVVLKGTDPNRPGFLVISPNRTVASTLLPAPNAASRVETKDGVPHVVIVGTGAKQTPPTNTDPVKPTPGAKPAQPEKVADGKILIETYDVAYCRGCKVGYLHTLVREYERDGKKLLYGLKKLTLQVARFGQVVEQWTEESTVESEDGKIFSTAMRQGIGKNQVLALIGKMTPEGLEVTIEGAAGGKELVKWPEGVLGVAKEATLLKDTKPKPGVGIEYKVYFGQFNGIITYKMTSKGVEEVADGTAKPVKLLKVIQEMVPVGDFKLPPVTYWVDPETYEPVKLETDLAALGGVLTAKRVSREVALAKPTKYLDLGEVQSIKLAAAVPDMHKKASVTYRITLGGDFPLDKAFPSDARQTVTTLDPKTRTIDLTVTAVRTPVQPKVQPPAPDKDYLADCYYIDWDNPLVKKHAAAAIARLPNTATAWDKAKAVEKWVHQNIKQVEFSQAMGTCGNTAKELSGDCTEHAMLACGMCRSLGIPSKTAIGMVYADTRNGPVMAYHMWFEVWVDDGWVALDAIMGLGSVGPGHVKIADAHWNGEKGFTPLLPVLGVLGTSPKVAVVK